MPSPFTPIAEYAFLSDLPHRCAGRARRIAWTGCASPSSTQPSVFGSLLDREAGTFRLGPFGINVPRPAPVRAGHERAGDDVEDAVGMGGGARRPDHGPDARARRRHTAHTAARRRRRAPHVGPHRRVPRRSRRGGAGLRARLRLRPGRRRLDDGRRAAHVADADGRDRRIRLHTDMRWASRGTVFGLGTCCTPARSSSAHCPGRRRSRRAGRLRPGPRAHRDDGHLLARAGWIGPVCPITVSASRSSARRSPSRHSRTCRREPPSPR